MRRAVSTAVLVLCACTPAPATPASPTAPRELRYVFITVDRPSGSAELSIDADGTWHGHYTYNDRGRGPDVTVTATLDSRGFPRTFHAVGHAYEKQPVDEVLEDRDGTLAWRSTTEHGSAADTAGFYVSSTDELAHPAQLVRAALAAPDHRIALLPAGTAWIEDDRVVPVTIAGTPRRLEQVAIAGIGFAPSMVWLHEHPALFGEVSPWQSIVPAGTEAAIPTLIAADKAWLAARAARLAGKLAHHPPPAGLAFVHAAVFDPTTRAILPDRKVVIAGDQITAVGDAATPIPPNAQTIDAHGRTLLPGLWDM